MKTLATILLVSLAIATARADVAVYIYKVNATKTGGGNVIKTTSSGFIIFDPQTLELANIQVLNSLQFHIQDVAFNVINTVSPAPGTTWTVIAIDGDGVGSTTCKGVNTMVNLGGLAGIYRLPKAFKFTTSDSTIRTLDGELTFLIEEKGVMVFNQPTTQSANSLGYSLAQTVESIRRTLLASGRQEQ